MKKQTAILLLLVMLLSRTELYQLCKMPRLVAHYLEHKHENPSLSLWAFLDLHYAHGDVRDADYDKDMQLPFKTCDYTGHIVAAVCTVHQPDVFIMAPWPHAPEQKQTAYRGFLPAAYQNKIFQPPRL